MFNMYIHTYITFYIHTLHYSTVQYIALHSIALHYRGSRGLGMLKKRIKVIKDFSFVLFGARGPRGFWMLKEFFRA